MLEEPEIEAIPDIPARYPIRLDVALNVYSLVVLVSCRVSLLHLPSPVSASSSL